MNILGYQVKLSITSPSKPRWRELTRSLPTYLEIVLLYDMHREKTYVGERTNTDEWSVPGLLRGELFEPTHWLPIPKLPTRDEE
jgi:hypothetical protein